MNANLSHDQRVVNGRKSWETRGAEGRARAGAIVKERWADPEYKERIAAALKVSRTPEQRTASAKKAWATRRANARA